MKDQKAWKRKRENREGRYPPSPVPKEARFGGGPYGPSASKAIIGCTASEFDEYTDPKMGAFEIFRPAKGRGYIKQLDNTDCFLTLGLREFKAANMKLLYWQRIVNETIFKKDFLSDLRNNPPANFLSPDFNPKEYKWTLEIKTYHGKFDGVVDATLREEKLNHTGISGVGGMIFYSSKDFKHWTDCLNNRENQTEFDPTVKVTVNINRINWRLKQGILQHIAKGGQQ